MLFIFSTPVLIRHLWQHKTVVFLHWWLICVVPFLNTKNNYYLVTCGGQIFNPYSAAAPVVKTTYNKTPTAT